jgi:hypothetical protein
LPRGINTRAPPAGRRPQSSVRPEGMPAGRRSSLCLSVRPCGAPG